ncbi:MAG: hypothetical protein ACHQ53_00520 [Polyangiales bacterium]
MEHQRLRRVVLVTAVLAALGALLWLDPLGLRGAGELAHVLAERGRVAVLGSDAALRVHAEGTRVFPVGGVPELSGALAGSDPDALVHALDHAGAQALLVDPSLAPRGAALAGRLGRYEHVAGLRGLYFSPAAALYAPDPIRELPEADRQALAVVARAVIGGARRPKNSSFPEPLRRLQPVEVMVLLRERGEARLWRSARGSSIATALLTAATVARDRWMQRKQTLGVLDAALPRLDVEVALLDDDGTIGDRDAGFIDRAFFAEHGVGYEQKGSWRYLLPDATREAGKGHASAAYRKLFREDGLPEDSFTRHELRLYRMLVSTIAISPGGAEPDDGLSPVRSPDEVLGTKKP